MALNRRTWIGLAVAVAIVVIAVIVIAASGGRWRRRVLTHRGSERR